MGRIILVRHSIPLVDPDMPACDWVLSPAGVTAAEALADRLGGLDVTRIISSDEPKACQTADILARARNWGLDLDPDLREHERCAAGYLPRAEFEASIARFFADPGQRVFGSESAAEVLARFSAAVGRACDANSGDVLLVTHGTALTTYLTREAGIDPLPFWQAMTMPMAVLLEGGTLTRL